jgi:hypothetical protein
VRWGQKIRRATGWVADAVRAPGALFYWNWRKGRYVRRGRRDVCPCQALSDDSVPGRVRCDAALHWNEPGRFRKICPLLVATPEGWRCSVPASEVRPFWGRAFQWLLVTAFVLYFAGATITWAGLRAVGRAPIGWWQVAWPGRWHEIKSVQSAYLFRRAFESFRAGRPAEASLALETAHVRDPGNYDIGLLLAQISMFQRSYLYSDDLFLRLWRDHPAERFRTAITYHDTLLSLDRMGKLAAFSVTMAQEDSARAAIWVRSALLAVRAMRSDEAVAFGKKQAAALAALAPHARILLAAELQLRSGDESAARAALRRHFDGPFNPAYAGYQVERLAELGDGGDAQVLLDEQSMLFGDFDRWWSQVAVALANNDTVLARAAYRRLLRGPLTLARVERLASLLIGHPDADLYRDLTQRLRMESTLEAAANRPTLWVSGVICGLPAEAGYWQQHGHQPPLAVYPATSTLDFSNRDLQAASSVFHLVNTVTMPRETILALLGRVKPQVASPPASRR